MKKFLIIAATLILIITAGLIYISYKHKAGCDNRDMASNCLPQGQCVAPNDAIVSCEDLKENPTKTDQL